MESKEFTDQGKAAMQEFGFAAVPLDQPGTPTPGRIANCLENIIATLDAAVATGDLGAIVNGLDDLKRLRFALDAWDGWMTQQNA